MSGETPPSTFGVIRSAIGWRLWYYRNFGRGVILRLGGYPKLFPTYRDMTAYVRTFTSLDRHPPVQLRVREVTNGSLLCRPGTSDPWVLWDTFRGRYHLPPKPLPSDCCIVDLGANVGYTAAHLASVYERARVIAVEMDGANAALATQNLAMFGPRCTLLQAAVWSEDGEIRYGGNEEQGFRISSLGKTPAAAAGTSVPARSIDSIFRQFDLDRVDYLKMDIEGAEDAVLKGSLDWAKRVQAMKIEFHPPASRTEGAEILTKLGFRCTPDPRHPHGLVAVR